MSSSSRRSGYTLGLRIAGSKQGNATAGIGWALIADRAKSRSTSGVSKVDGDPAQAALALARKRNATKVSLRQYADPAALMRSEHAGQMDFFEHRALIQRTRTLLEDNGFQVEIEEIG